MGPAQECQRSAHEQDLVTKTQVSRNAFRCSSKVVAKIVRSKPQFKWISLPSFSGSYMPTSSQTVILLGAPHRCECAEKWDKVGIWEQQKQLKITFTKKLRAYLLWECWLPFSKPMSFRFLFKKIAVEVDWRGSKQFSWLAFMNMDMNMWVLHEVENYQLVA